MGVSPNNRFACDAKTAFIMYHWAPDMYVVVLLQFQKTRVLTDMWRDVQPHWL
jgi:hypothetical protein